VGKKARSSAAKSRAAGKTGVSKARSRSAARRTASKARCKTAAAAGKTSRARSAAASRRSTNTTRAGARLSPLHYGGLGRAELLWSVIIALGLAKWSSLRYCTLLTILAHHWSFFLPSVL